MLVTRPEPGASETAARLRSMGFHPVIAPLLEIEVLYPTLPDPASVQAVLITSGNALPALSASWRATPLLTVGNATAARARAAGFADVASADGDATALAAFAAARCGADAGPLLIAAGKRRGGDVATSLASHGFDVSIVEVYDARPAAALPPAALEAIRTRSLHAALFFSAETARTFARLAPPERDALRDVRAVAIGQPAAVALEALPWRSIYIAQRPTQDEVFACLR